ncbi:MAG TPA: AmmeMemoRadiSam system protein B [Rhodothermales bacterium]|nr:AmmeMemoRadiSam system protein B [Rhodothermales bacterium]
MSVVEQAVYPTQRTPLRAELTNLLKNAPTRTINGEIQAIIVPDTNKIEGGYVAADVYKCLEGRRYDSVVLISPSHSGPFRRITICKLDNYQTPLGELTIDDRLRNELCDEDDDIYLDDRGHFHTDGIDVQLPFLQTVLEPGFGIVPVVMGDETPEFCRELGHAVGEVMYNRRTLVVASADIVGGTDEALSQFKQHFENRDIPRLMSLLNSNAVNVEGKGPLLVALIAALERRAAHADILRLQPPRETGTGSLGAVIWR